MNLTPTANGQLFVWTDIDPAHEADFNAWYDREHMEERVAIPGMLWARRYRAHDDAARRYLAIYRTESLGTFTSDAYRAAFTRQTDWSNRNFARMGNTQRRVMAVSAEAGFGAGCAVALAELGELLAARHGNEILSADVAFGELTLTIHAKGIVGLVKALIDNPAARFATLIDITAVDHPDRPARFDVVWHLLSMHTNQRIRLKAAVREDELWLSALTPTGTGVLLAVRR